MTTKRAKKAAKKAKRVPRVARTRNGGKWTESEFFGKIRATLRNMSRWWVPAAKAKEKAKRKNTTANKRLKWVYQCAHCLDLFKSTDVAVHHTIDAGSLKNFSDLAGFAERLFCEDISLYEVVCHSCHIQHHKNQKLKV